MLADAVSSAGLQGLFDIVLSVEPAGIFKTSPRAHALVEAALKVRPSEAACVSSNRWDVAGAAAFGLRSVWANRLGMPDEYPDLTPVATVRDLDALRGDAGR